MAAIVFSGKLSRNGWLPPPGRVMRIVEDLGRFNVALIVGDRLPAAALPDSIAPLCSRLTSRLADRKDPDVSASVVRTFAEYSALRVFSSDFLSEGVASPSLRLPDSFALVTAGMEIREVDSSAKSGIVGNLASMASIAFRASRKRLASGPRPTVSPTVNANTADKNSAANTAT